MVNQSMLKLFALTLAVVLTACGMRPVASHVKGYLTTPSGKILKNDQGQCWRTVDWQPSMAIAECDPELAFIATGQVEVPIDEPEPEMVEEIAEVAVEEQPAEVIEQSVEYVTITEDKPFTLSGDTSFYFGLSALTPEAKNIIRRLATRLKDEEAKDIEINVVGYTDRLGSKELNQELSTERAESVKNELVKNGLDAQLIKAIGKGDGDAITSLDLCPNSLSRGELIVCLTPDRRVEITIKGMQETTRVTPVNATK